MKANYICVLCETQEQFNYVITKANCEVNITKLLNRTIPYYQNIWNEFKDKTVVSIMGGSYGHLDSSLKSNDIIISYDEFELIFGEYKENKTEHCNDCINDYDDPQMCKLCVDGSHQTLGQ